MTKIFGHRGAAADYPENTMISFQAAYEAGADGIELDVQQTKDGELVVLHDESVNRTTDGSGYVKDLTFAQISSINAAARWSTVTSQAIPTLEEVLQWASDKPIWLNIELKNNVFPYKGMEERLILLLRKYGNAERIILSSFNHESIVKITRSNPEYETALLLSDSLVAPWVYANQLGITALHPKWRHVDKHFIEHAHMHETAVRPYTVNKVEVMKRLIHAKVDAIITDYPEKAVQLRNDLILS
ncbi:glycerophosphodiester phosphodiesterase [Bacillus tianshenii]|nr:glycerophosphodiester phosphodiesterase [Bacillus tianshenii]